MRRIPGAFWIGSLLLILSLLPVLLGRIFVTGEMANVFGGIPNLPPGWTNPLGTQSEGRDILASLMLGTPATLLIGLMGGGVSTLAGIFLGFVSGYFGGRTDAVIRTVVDVGMTIPPLAILILISASFPSLSIAAMGLVIAATLWMSATRVIRAQVLTLRERDYVLVAKLSGVGDFRIIALELLPNLIPFLAAIFVNCVTTAIVSSIGLEVLGLGPKQSITLGNTIYEAIYYTAMWRGMWWWWLPPLLIMVFVFLGLFLIGSSLDQLANPRLRKAP